LPNSLNLYDKINILVANTLLYAIIFLLKGRIGRAGGDYMFASVIAATFNYVDIAVLVLAVLTILIGIYKGLIKSMKGFFTTVLVFIGALFLTEIVSAALLNNTQLGDILSERMEGFVNSWGVAFSGELQIMDGVVRVNSNGTFISSKEALGKLGVLSSFYDKIAIKAVPNGGASMADVIVPNVVKIVAAAVSFLVLFIALKIVLAIIRKGLNKITEANPMLKKVDRGLGAVWGAAYGVASIFVILAIIRMLADKAWMSPVIEFIDNSMMTKTLYDVNPLFDLLNGMFGV
jgi:uncharacterized membrane protein required for colicin V production